MFSGIAGIDGTAWYHPRRLSLDGGAVAGGVAQPGAERARRARHARRDLGVPIYAFETSLGAGPRARAARGRWPAARASRAAHAGRPHRTYDHIDPLSALPDRNAFVKTVVPFLRRIM